MASLYEINSNIEEIISRMYEEMEETGEISEETTDKLTWLKEERDTKIENIGCYIKNLKSEAEAIKEEEKRLKARREAKENLMERLKFYVSRTLDGQKFESPRVAFSYRKSEAVAILDESAIPEVFMKVKTETVPDKVKIKEALKAGEAVPGTDLEVKNNLQIK